MSIAELKSMSRDEQLLAMEILWEELSREDQQVESPAWHKEVLDERQSMVAEDSASYLTMDELKKRLRP
ncbi:addiction module protein [Tichowtungia aerotolerans]|uniref:Addiction module component CHP02574 family protein n=1 Tax=Tichowtungia aerotolerans TaxID=2697043 RepID=A0A6P1M971_9BACT|nr:addiction module protein [Tichowtungia aerotolerans]QHI69094.1 addiction module component CHP02574 family protein [Tichowtungia aerotolerans]